MALLTETAEVLFAPSLGATEGKIRAAVEATGGYSCRHVKTDVAGEGRGGRFRGEVGKEGGEGGREGGYLLQYGSDTSVPTSWARH